MVTANSVKFSSVTYKIFPSKTGEPSRSTFDAQSLVLDTIAGIRQYPSSFAVVERFEQPSTAQKFAITRNVEISFKSVLGHIRFVLTLVLHFAKSRDVTSLLKWVFMIFDHMIIL